MKVSCAVIGGTGVGNILLERPGKAVWVPTEFGGFSGIVINLGNQDILAVNRHSAGHKLPPHRINYRAIAAGLKQLGVRTCFATAAVGSLRSEWKPGTLVSCSDFLDFTGRSPTLFDSIVKHVDFSEPMSSRLGSYLIDGGRERGVNVKSQAVYVGTNGPRYETPQEIEVYRKLGGDIVGMTASSEAIVMREVGIEYCCLAIVTNLASGLSDAKLEHLEVVDVMNELAGAVFQILECAVNRA